MKIYTRKGDEGSTSLISGECVSKDNPRVEAYGTLDEANSALGVARAAGTHEFIGNAIEHIQNQLFKLGADLASSTGGTRIGENDIQWLEQEIDRMAGELPQLRNFILPGGTVTAANIHLARAICRRAERQTIALRCEVAVPANAVAYLNRLSDFLFTLARYENLLSGVPEEKWTAA